MRSTKPTKTYETVNTRSGFITKSYLGDLSSNFSEIYKNISFTKLPKYTDIYSWLFKTSAFSKF